MASALLPHLGCGGVKFNEIFRYQKIYFFLKEGWSEFPKTYENVRKVTRLGCNNIKERK